MWSSYINQKFKIMASHIELYVLTCGQDRRDGAKFGFP